MRVSVVIPVLDDAAALAGTLRRVRATAGGPLEVIVVDGGSTDSSAAVAAELSDKVLSSPKGRSLQLHAGALAAAGDILLFLHADTELPADWRPALEAAWSRSPRPAATAFRLGFDRDTVWFRFIARMADWRASWTGVPHGDQALAMARGVYLAAGGFPPVPIMEEYALLRKLDGPVFLLEPSVRTSARRYEAVGPVRGTLRNVCLIALYYAGVPPRVLAKFYG